MTGTSWVHQCTHCGQFSKVLTCAQSPLTHAEVLLCPTCFAWRAKESEQPGRTGAWRAAHAHAVRLEDDPPLSKLAG
jgi:hypothetical protein